MSFCPGATCIKKQVIISFILCTFKIVTKSSIQILGKKDGVFFIKNSRNRLVYCYNYCIISGVSKYVIGGLLRLLSSNDFIAN